MVDYILNKYDMEAAKMIDDFLPDKLFDAHMHICHFESKFSGHTSFDTYYDAIKMFGKNRTVRCNGIIFPNIELLDPVEMDNSVKYLCKVLDDHDQTVGEIVVLPTDTWEEIERRLTHDRIRGIKCYHVYADKPDTANADVGEFLPESAWQVANEKKLVITLHLVKNEALGIYGTAFNLYSCRSWKQRDQRPVLQ